MNPCPCTSFVHKVYCLVGKPSVRQELNCQVNRKLQSAFFVFNVVVFSVAAFKPVQNLNTFIAARLKNVYLLEAAGKGPVLFKNLCVFFKSGGTNAADFSFGKNRL